MFMSRGSLTNGPSPSKAPRFNRPAVGGVIVIANLFVVAIPPRLPTVDLNSSIVTGLIVFLISFSSPITF